MGIELYIFFNPTNYNTSFLSLWIYLTQFLGFLIPYGQKQQAKRVLHSCGMGTLAVENDITLPF